jgi:hypothetical protein
MRTIGLEEHFVTEELAAYGAGTATVAQLTGSQPWMLRESTCRFSR